MKNKLLLTLILTLIIPLANFSQTAKDNTSSLLTDWMSFHSKLVRRTSGIAHVAYSRQFCYTAIAAYESIVKSNASYRSLAGQLTGLNSLPQAGERLYYPASLNAAYAAMLHKFYASFPACLAVIDSMEKAQEERLSKTKLAQNVMVRSKNFGKAIAGAIGQWADDDGASITKTYVPLQGEGVWTPTAAAAEPYWYEKRSLTNDLFSAYSLTPPRYSTDTASDFYKTVNDVYTTTTNLTPEQKATALYWDDSPGETYLSVFGHWTSILSGLIKQKELSLMDGAAAFAKMTITLHEATLLAWKGKYQYNVVRPITFIQQFIDKTWTPLIATPPHPEFPAAHATFSYAAAMALCSLFGEACSVTDNTYTDVGMKERSYTSLQDVAHEAGYSRLYGGIHYRYSIEQGFLLGEAAAKHVDQAIQFKVKK